MSSAQLTDALRETVALFDSPEPRTTTEIAEALDLGRRSTYERLDRLVEAGRLETKSVGANGRVWWRPTETGAGESPAHADGSTQPMTPPREGQTPATVDGARPDVANARGLYDVIFNGTFQFIGLLAPDGTLLEANDAALSFGGVTRADVVGAPFWEADWWQVSAEARARLRAAVRRAATGEFVRYETPVQGDDGTAVIDFSLRPVTDGDGSVKYLVPEGRDISARKAREQELRRERDLVDRILDTSPVAIQVIDQEGAVTRMNDRAAELFGEPDGDAVPPPGSHRFTDTDGTPVQPADRPFARTLETGAPVTDWRGKLTAPDGTERWLSVNAAPIHDADGEVTKVVTTSDDVTQLEQLARRLERQRDDLESELEEVFGRISDGVYGLDAERRLTYLNDRAETLLDVDRTTAIGREIGATVPLTERFEAALETAREERRAVSFEEYHAALDGWFDTTVYPSETGVSVYFRDVTDRKQRERQIDRYRRWHQTLVENYPSGAVAIVDTDLRYVTFGGTLEGETDVTSAELEGEPVREALPERLADVVVPGYEAALDGRPSTFEATIDDRTYEFHFHPVRDASGEVFAATALSQEVTERKAREQQLRDRVSQQETVADLGQRALEEPTLEAVMADATALVADTLGTDYCKVLDLRPDDDELLLREGVGWEDGLVGAATVSAVDADSQAAYTLATEQPVIVEDLTTDARFSGPPLLTDHDVKSGISTIIGSPAEPWGILGTHDTASREFSEHDAAFVQSVANILATTVERHRHEQTLREQRSQLAALNDINTVVWGVAGEMFDQSTRSGIETTLCDGLTEVPSYDAAWIAAVDHQRETVDPRTAAGFADDPSAIPLAAAEDAPVGQQVLAKAVRTGDMQVAAAESETEAIGLPVSPADVDTDARSVAAIPIVHEGTTYGLLGLVSAREGAFVGAERAVVGQLGAVAGHAIAAIERERVLVSDEVTEIELTVPDYLESAGVVGPTDGTLTVDRMISVDDETFLGYGTADADAVETLTAMDASHPAIDEVRILDEDADPVRFELRTDAPLQSELSAQGGSVHEIRIDDGDLGVTIHLPPSVTVRRITDAVERLYPNADLRSRRQVTRETPPAWSAQRLTDELTRRQRTVLEVAVSAGYFASPRDASGEAIADSLDIAPSTFHYHLREAQRKLFESAVPTRVPSDQS